MTHLVVRRRASRGRVNRVWGVSHADLSGSCHPGEGAARKGGEAPGVWTRLLDSADRARDAGRTHGEGQSGGKARIYAEGGYRASPRPVTLSSRQPLPASVGKPRAARPAMSKASLEKADRASPSSSLPATARSRALRMAPRRARGVDRDAVR